MSSTSSTFFSRVRPVPEPFHLRLMREFPADPDPRKRSYLFGAYRDEGGRPFVLPEVVEVEKEFVREDEEGNERESAGEISRRFSELAAEFLLGKDSPAIKEGRVVSQQCCSNGNAVRVMLDFLRWALEAECVYISDPAWLTHDFMAARAGYDVRWYRYWDSRGRRVDWEGLLEDLGAAPEGSVVILQPCGHNPTGIDPSKEQWKELCQLMTKRKLFPLFDCAYQGFASGDPEADVWSVRHFISSGMEVAITQSFGKNFGIYGERCGNAVVVLESKKMVPQVKTEVNRLARSYSHSFPAFGARIVTRILSDPGKTLRWKATLRGMVDKIENARKALRKRLDALDGEGDWSHITNQKGMFSYTGLTKEQCVWMQRERKVYFYLTGRMNMSALSQKDVDNVAESMVAAVKNA